ncbi:MAG: hypothetical protein KJN63_10390 [Acidimicrobiia bacterium]|nr:hypothetical protein [Acidimicrobiia bacterium]NNF63120.1 hypothetical protein [Acidimicrobiia bacterium]
MLKRLVAIMLLSSVFLVPASFAVADTGQMILATEADESEVPDADTAVVPSGAAVDADLTEEEAAEQPWTQRYLVPTLILLAAIAVGSSFLYYVVRLRSRYTVVE